MIDVKICDKNQQYNVVFVYLLLGDAEKYLIRAFSKYENSEYLELLFYQC